MLSQGENRYRPAVVVVVERGYAERVVAIRLVDVSFGGYVLKVRRRGCGTRNVFRQWGNHTRPAIPASHYTCRRTSRKERGCRQIEIHVLAI